MVKIPQCFDHDPLAMCSSGYISVAVQAHDTNTILCIFKKKNTPSSDHLQLFLLVCIHQYRPAAAVTPGTSLWALQLCAHSCPEQNVVYFQSPTQRHLPLPLPRLPLLFLVGSQTECIHAGRFNCKQCLGCRCRRWVTFTLGASRRSKKKNKTRKKIEKRKAKQEPHCKYRLFAPLHGNEFLFFLIGRPTNYQTRKILTKFGANLFFCCFFHVTHRHYFLLFNFCIVAK